MKIHLGSLLLVVMVVLSACGGTTATPSPTLDPVLVADLSTIANNMAENLISSIYANDLNGFQENMDQVMISAMTEDAFIQIQALLDNRIGSYQSLILENLSSDQGFYIANFTLSGDIGNTPMRLVLELETPHLITGLWFPD